MIRIFYLSLAALFLLSSPALAQKRKVNKNQFQRKNQSVFPPYPQFKQKGWIVAPGATYMLTTFVKRNKTLVENDSLSYTAGLKPTGKVGLYLEGGRYRILQYSKLVKYIDYGLAYKWLRGKEKFDGELTNNLDNSVMLANSGLSKYSNHYFMGHFNLNNVIKMSDRTFLQNTLGINLDYSFISSRSTEQTVASVTQNTPPNFIAQIHYKLGYGIKVNSKLLIIPSVETPILNINPFETGQSTLGHFNTRHRPLIFSLRFLFLRPYVEPPCKPVKTPDGFKMPTDMDKQNQMDGGVK